MDEDQLNRQLRSWERRLDREYDREHPSRSVIRRCKGMIKEINMKLRAMERFVAETNNIYDRPESMLRALSQTEEKLKGVSYNPETRTIQYDGLLNAWIFHLRLLSVLPPTAMNAGDIQKSPLELTGDEAWKYLHTQGFSEDELRELDDMGFVGATAVAAWEEMRDTGVVREDIRKMEGKGYTLGGLLDIWERLEGNYDKQFYGYMIQGTDSSYRDAFSINPDNLSQTMQFTLLYHTNVLAENKNTAELEKLINAMLYTDENHSWYPVNEDGQAYGSDYIERMYAASSFALEQEASALLGGRHLYTDQVMDALGEQIKLQSDMNTLWAALRETAFNDGCFDQSGMSRMSQELPYGGKIEDLTYAATGFSFQYQFATAWIKDAGMPVDTKNIQSIEWHPDYKVKVDCSINMSQTSMNAQERKERIQAIREAQETLWLKYAYQTGSSLIGIVSPEAGAVLGLGEALASRGAKKTGSSALAAMEKSGYLSEEFIQKYKSGATGAVIAGGNFIDYVNELEGLDTKINAENARQRLEWFGATSSVDVSNGTPVLDENGNDEYKGRWTITVNEGYYNVNAIKNLAKWEKEGLAGVLDQEIRNRDIRIEIIDRIESQLKSDKTLTQEATILLHGGGDILQMDSEKFAQTIQDIEKAYTNAYKESDKKSQDKAIKIQSIFQKQ